MNLPIVTSLRVSDLLADGDAFFEQSHNLGIRLKPEKNPRPSAVQRGHAHDFLPQDMTRQAHCAVIAQEARLEYANRPEGVCFFDDRKGRRGRGGLPALTALLALLKLKP
jgi:hypothetical protein